MKWIWIVAVALAACGKISAQEITKITNEELTELIKKPEVQLVDIRTPGEWSSGVISGARLIDFYHPDFVKQVGKLDKQKPVVLYCAVGGRSAVAAEKLRKLGFETVYDLTGGVRHWRMDGNELVKPE